VTIISSRGLVQNGAASGRGQKPRKIVTKLYPVYHTSEMTVFLEFPKSRETDSNPRSPVAGRGQAARNQIFRRTTGAEAALETVIPDAGGLRVRIPFPPPASPSQQRQIAVAKSHQIPIISGHLLVAGRREHGGRRGAAPPPEVRDTKRNRSSLRVERWAGWSRDISRCPRSSRAGWPEERGPELNR
jgi:hypothetical protein